MLMFGVIQIAIFIMLIRLLITSGRPFLCAGLNTVVMTVSSILGACISMQPVTSAFWIALLIGTVILFALNSLYFWLLHRIDSGILWWIVLIGGPVVVVALRAFLE